MNLGNVHIFMKTQIVCELENVHEFKNYLQISKKILNEQMSMISKNAREFEKTFIK